MNLKKIIIGEKMPDKNDPKYKDLHDSSVKAGKTFAETVRLDKAAAKVQTFASRYPKIFLCIIFGFVLFSVALNLYRMSTAVSHKRQPSSAVERQEKELRFNRHHGREQQTEKTSQVSNPSNTKDYEHHRQD